MKFSLAPVFTDGLVFQQNKPICVFGTGEEGLTIEASIDNNKAQAFVKDGKWKLYLPPMKADRDKVLTLRGNEQWLTVKDIAIGEVWLAGGQSNMEFELHNAALGMQMLKKDHPDVRFYYTPKYEYEDEKFEPWVKGSHWEKFNEFDAAKWSAVGYLFAKELSEKLGVTVGIIGCNCGGTSASAWVPQEDLRVDSQLSLYMEEIDRVNKEKTLEEQLQEYLEYQEYQKAWDVRCADIYSREPNIEWPQVLERIGENRYPGPMNSYSVFRPAGLYKTMLSKVIAYSVAGVIFYQGESDDHMPGSYEKLFRTLVQRWRADNGDLQLPFLAVMLPMHKYKLDPDFKNWPIIRDNQRKVVDALSNMGLANCIDLGEFNEIHPHDKRQVAHRLYLQAAKLVYGVETEARADAPRASWARVDGGSVIVHLKNARGGLELRKDAISGFEVAPFDSLGRDEDFEPATATLCDDNIRIASMNISKPGYVRYLWTNYADVPLYGQNGLPLEPFNMKLL